MSRKGKNKASYVAATSQQQPSPPGDPKKPKIYKDRELIRNFIDTEVPVSESLSSALDTIMLQSPDFIARMFIKDSKSGKKVCATSPEDMLNSLYELGIPSETLYSIDPQPGMGRIVVQCCSSKPNTRTDF